MSDRPRPAPLTSLGFWRDYAVTLRPYLFFVSGASGLLGLALAPDVRGLTLLLAGAAFFLAYGLGQAVTDVFQTDTDALSAPFRPLVLRRIGKGQVLAVSLVGLGLCAALFALLNPWTLVPSTLAVVGLATYTPFKRRWWGGPPWNAWIVACLPVIGYLCGGSSLAAALSDPKLWLAMVSIFATYAIFVLLGYFKDVAADRATGYQTLPVRFGRRASILVSWGLLAAGAIASTLLVVRYTGANPAASALWLFGIALLAAAHLAIWRTERDEQALPTIALIVIGYVALHLGEAALLRELFTLPGYVLVALSIVVLTLRPYRSQI